MIERQKNNEDIFLMRIINKQYHIVSHENAFLYKKKKALSQRW